LPDSLSKIMAICLRHQLNAMLASSGNH